ncbi:MAG: selenocysteine-specific translation elongation factor [Candidatus Poribacteria bacterium]|nr:selenocysteine-specific translation elongation factor [Candidatus Poribacteria bacterium]MDE0506897.1 selenocysteine-specific translation elongation factor [Candidatus Poribacteria bacterium]
MRHVIIGTAGHVDHGKSALIHALTGIETDRLKEEKERGLSIELGFAYFGLPDGSRAGIVDVPGHEKFIRNMLSGAYGMDVVLLVVDSKEGVQEQTLEHLEILDLLGLSTGILVMTKADLVTPKQLAESSEIAQEMLVGSALEGIPTIHVSSETGQGLDALKNLIAQKVNSVAEVRQRDGIPRLYVDRVFTMQGFGAVVTGTLISGSIQREQRLIVLPQGHEVRVRGLQVHNESADRAYAGQRTALNLSGINAHEIERGNVICPIGFSQVTDNIDVSLRVLSSFPRPLEHWTRLRFYLGTSEVFCRAILLVDDTVKRGGQAQIQLRLESPILTFRSDRFIVRDFSAQHTVGGGQVTNPFAPRHRRFTEETLEVLDEWSRADAADVISLVLTQNRDLCIPQDSLHYYLPNSYPTLDQHLKTLEADHRIISWGGRLISAANRTEAAESTLLGALGDFHEKNPLASGQNSAQLQRQIELDDTAFERIVNRLVQRKQVVKAGNLLRMMSHKIEFSSEAEGAKDKIEQALLRLGLNTPNLGELESQFSDISPQVFQETFYALLNLGRFVKIADGYFVHTDTFQNTLNVLTNYLQKNDIITVSEFRELADTSRKYAVPFLEYCDAQGITIREDNHRRMRKSAE